MGLWVNIINKKKERRKLDGKSLIDLTNKIKYKMNKEIKWLKFDWIRKLQHKIVRKFRQHLL